MKLGEGTTPGPWKIEDDILFDKKVIGPSEQSGARDILYQGPLANARLIAKAPLLIECRDVLDKVALFGEYPDKLSIGHEAALRELGRNARALLAKLES